MPIFHNMRVVVKPGFCIMIALLLLIFPLKWVVAWFVAAAVHELFHYIALQICRVGVFSITLCHTGAVMETAEMSGPVEIICTLAGPVGGLSLLVLARWLPHIAICAFLQSAYNLLPIFPLDGGRALHSWTYHAFGTQRATLICKLTEFVIFALLFAIAGICLLYLELGPIPMIGVFLILLKNKRIKIPCKQNKQIVQ